MNEDDDAVENRRTFKGDEQEWNCENMNEESDDVD